MNIYILFIFALIPILWLVISMGASLLKAHIATFSVFLITLVLALVIWGMPLINALTAALKGMLLVISAGCPNYLPLPACSFVSGT
jgi:lactate permease